MEGTLKMFRMFMGLISVRCATEDENLISITGSALVDQDCINVTNLIFSKIRASPSFSRKLYALSMSLRKQGDPNI